jgi:hypothetical protein
VVTAILDALLLIAGIALLVLPGPGFVLVAAGPAVLATRFEWARKPLDYAKDKAQQGICEVARGKGASGSDRAGRPRTVQPADRTAR